MLTYFSAEITLTTPWVSLPIANIEHGEYNMTAQNMVMYHLYE